VRAVLDTNVIVSAVLSPTGAPRSVLEAWRDGRFELIASPRLLAELRRVLEYPKLRRFVTVQEADELVSLVEDASLVVGDPEEAPPVRSLDPDDDYLIALAATSRSILVTGDSDLLELSTRIPVVTPAKFLEILDSDPSPS
jgi:putative PIN family toxin of toxin-antitoxin system